MAKIYLYKIRIGDLTIDDVPLRWRAEVQLLLREGEITTNEQ